MKFNEDVWNDGKFSIVLDDMGYNIELYNWYLNRILNTKYNTLGIMSVHCIVKVDS